MKKTIATDLDGCLLKPLDVEHLVCNENKKVLKKFDNVFFISGRNSNFIKQVCKETNVKENYAAYNGGVIYINGKEVYKEILDSKPTIEIINYIKNNFKEYIIYLMDDLNNVYSLSDSVEKVINKENNTLIKKPRHGYISIKDEEIIYDLIRKNEHLVKINAILNDKDKWQLFNYIQDNKILVSAYPCNHAVEITGPNSNKGKAVDYMVNYFKLNRDEVYTCGDDNNDLDMFDNYKNSFLVKRENYNYVKDNYTYLINEFKEIANYLKED